jgi:hypothetical protein
MPLTIILFKNSFEKHYFRPGMPLCTVAFEIVKNTAFSGRSTLSRHLIALKGYIKNTPVRFIYTFTPLTRTVKLELTLNSLFSIAIICGSCSSDDPMTITPADPVIVSFSPDHGQMTQPVIITGKNFSPVLLDNVVLFNKTPALVQQSSAEELMVIVPDSATTGKIQVTVGGKAGTSQNDFTILSPIIETISSKIGSPGLSITITGTNFLAEPAFNHVFIGDAEAVINSSTITQLQLTVPDGATTGKIKVQVGSQKAVTPDDFEVCDGMPELIISDVQVTGSTGSEYSMSCKLTNVGNTDLDLSKMVMQNYVSEDGVYDGSDSPAGGWVLGSGGILQQGESYENVWSANADYSARPNLIVTIYATDDSVNECNTENNIVSKAIE